jgi:secretion/DNA translocation related TadE-like protein
MRAGGRTSERGSASVLVLTVFAALAVGTVLLAVVAGAVVAQRRAAAAADLAALAGAAALQRGADGCAAAAGVSRRNGAELLACRASGDVVQVTVGAELPVRFGRRLTVSAQARAGPA